MNTPPTASPPPEGVLDQLLSSNYGWWCQYIEDVPGADGKPASRLVGVPHVNRTFCELYGYPSDEGISLGAGNVSRGDLRRLVAAKDAAMAVGALPRTERAWIRTAAGKYKFVEVFFGRIRLPDGKPALASLHKNLGETGYITHLEQEILGKLEAYVFVKKYDPETDMYLFEYVNDRLAEVLDPTGGRAAICDGKQSDRDYFDEQIELDNFRSADDEVYHSTDENVRVVREEMFTPKGLGRAAGGSSGTRRLMTIKTQYRPHHWRDDRDNRILGIAFDVTALTDLQRTIANLSDDAIYLKDRYQRYRMVNNGFLRMIGIAEERRVLGKTFPQVMAEADRPTEDLNREINAEDSELFVTPRTLSHVRRPVGGSYRGPWVTVKRSFTDRAGHKYILGNARPLFDNEVPEGLVPLPQSPFGYKTPPHQTPPERSLWQRVVDRSPQRISVKWFNPGATNKRNKFRIVWGNEAFIDHHLGRVVNGEVITDVIGKSDYDLWPEPDADTYRTSDELALRITQNVETSPGWNGLSSKEKLSILRDALVKAKTVEFTEYQQSRDGMGQTRLQTTKWAMRLGDASQENPPAWFVVVISSDTTRVEAEIKEYHRQTVHVIRNDFDPAHMARDYLQQFLDTGDRTFVEKAFARITVACRSMSEFLDFHRHLLRMQPTRVPRPVAALNALMEEAVAVAREGRNKTIRWSVPPVDAARAGALVAIDETYLKYVIRELLWNAQKSIRALQQILDLGAVPGGANVKDFQELKPVPADFVPAVSVRLAVDETHCVMTVADTGVACFSASRRDELLSHFRLIAERPAAFRERHTIGLSFCCATIQLHGGALEVAPRADVTELVIKLPLYRGA
jgi:PAS domain S-box-containing protein